MTKPIDPTSPKDSTAPEALAEARPSQAPQTPSQAPGVHAMRRGGARREVSERVSMRAVPAKEGGESGRLLEGWALNVSRGGLRAILEDKVELGERFEVTLGDGDLLVRTGRIVWVQEEPDGVIVGLEFLGATSSPSGTQKSVPPPAPDGSSSRATPGAPDQD